MDKIPPPAKNAMFDERLTVVESKINEIVEFLGLLPIEVPDTSVDLGADGLYDEESDGV